MPDNKVVCNRCGRRRYIDRMEPGIVSIVSDQSGDIEHVEYTNYWVCTAKASCRAARKACRQQDKTEQPAVEEAAKENDTTKEKEEKTMIMPRKSIVTVVRHEYRIPSPATQKDMLDTLYLARQDMSDKGITTATYDDAVMVEAQDDEIVAYWVETDKSL